MNGEMKIFLEKASGFNQINNDQDGGWSADFRDRALNNIKSSGIPSSKTEKYRHMDMSAFLASSVSSKDQQQNAVVSTADYHFNFVGGYFREDLTKKENLPSGLEYSLLGGSEVQDILAQFVDSTDFFQQMSNSFMDGGLLIKVKKNHTLDSPITIGNHDPKTNEALSLPRILVVMEEGASAELIEHYRGFKGVSWTQSLTEIYIEKRACLYHTSKNTGCPTGTQLNSTKVKVLGAGEYHNLSLFLGGKKSRNNLDVELLGEHAHCELVGLFSNDDSGICQNFTHIHHRVGDTTSVQYYKGLLDQKSLGVFNGTIFVHPKAQNIDSNQLNKNLLLSNLAHVETKPTLEIHADDVKCSHGATIGRLQEDEIFYLQSRGITKKRAVQILSEAFAIDAIYKFKGTQDREATVLYVKEFLETLPALKG